MAVEIVSVPRARLCDGTHFAFISEYEGAYSAPHWVSVNGRFTARVFWVERGAYHVECGTLGYLPDAAGGRLYTTKDKAPMSEEEAFKLAASWAATGVSP